MFFLVLLCCLWLSSCERDDICAETTPTTPLLVIDFFDADNPTEPKAPNNLIIAEAGTTTGLLVNTATVSIPLRTDEDQSSFVFVLNSGSEEIDNPQNIDDITFSYTRTEEYVSKACGFRVLYQALQEQLTSPEDDFWIEDIIIVNPTIEDEAQAHIRILH